MDAQILAGRLREVRRATLARCAPLDPAALQQPSTWRGAPTTMAHRLQWLAEGDETRAQRILETRVRLGVPLTPAQMALAAGGAARGRLLGLLAGVPAELYERSPAPDEWSLRRVLGHVIATDARYRIAVEYAVDRARNRRGGPLRPPDSALPPRSGEAESAGTIDELLARLFTTRDQVIGSLSVIPDDLLDAPTNWVAWDLDVRFRLHRFAAHDREHAIQVRITLQALGFAPTEAQLLLADAEAARSTLEVLVLGTPAALLGQTPPDGGPSIAALVEESIADERGPW